MKNHLFFLVYQLPPSLEEMQQYFDNYDDILVKAEATGVVVPCDIIADSSDDSIEAFHRRHYFYWDDCGANEARRKEYERYELERWRRVRAQRAAGFIEPWKIRLPSEPPPPPPRRPAIDPFFEVRRRKLLPQILEKTRRIREELKRRHEGTTDHD